MALNLQNAVCSETCLLALRDANEIVIGGDADFVFLRREFLREPYWVKAQHEPGEEPSWPTPYGYAVQRRAK